MRGLHETVSILIYISSLQPLASSGLGPRTSIAGRGGAAGPICTEKLGWVST